jgi:hypothetical protein
MSRKPPPTHRTIDTPHADDAQLALDFAALGDPPAFALDPRDRQGLGELGRSRPARDGLTEHVG